MRGYFGIAFYEPKFIVNIGTAVRSAKCFGASFIAVIGGR
jgi:tRNA(Leu) C34 or U34 (ribose-2'-O)-methylase TrmL